MIAILMGVTGTGKTTIGRALAQSTGWAFADADDFHSEANHEKMRAGIPLTDEDRVPWLESLHAQIVKWHAEGTNAILACSALRESYRAMLIDGIPRKSVRFFYLNGPPSLIRERLEGRHGHYMPASLLPSQLATLEPPRDAIGISINQTVPAMVQRIISELAQKAYAEQSGIQPN